MLVHLYVLPRSGKTVRLWLPLFLLWPLLLLLLAPALVVAAIADVALWLAGRRYHHYSVLLVRALGLLGETRGMVVKMKNEEAEVDFTVF